MFYPVPFDKIVAEVCKDAKLRRLVKNMIYDGVLSQLLNIDLARDGEGAGRQLGKKPKAIELNLGALEAGFKYAEQSISSSGIPYWIERMNKTTGKILVEGNAAAALGCMFAGVTVVAWYPITPSSSLPETLIGYMRKYRMDKETGKATFAIVQAEDEIASIGMVDRRGLGRRAGDDVDVGPGHLADERVRRPGVLRRGPRGRLRHPARRAVDRACRRGPRRATCSPPPCCRTATRKHIMLIPASVEECYTMAMDAFDLAERFQTLVFVMSDLDLGMNTWMSHPFSYPGEADRSRQGPRRGEAGADRAVGPLQGRGRRRHSVSHDSRARACRPTSRAVRVTTRWRSTPSARTTTRTTWTGWPASSKPPAYVPQPIVETGRAPRSAIIAYGSSHWAVEEGRDQIERGAGMRTALPAAAGVSVRRGVEDVHRQLRSRLRRRAESRRADAEPAAAGSAPVASRR